MKATNETTNLGVELEAKGTMMPTKESFLQLLTGTVIPPLAGALATWLLSTQVFSVLHLSAGTATYVIGQVLVFGVTAAGGWLTVHHILSGHYTPAAKALAGGSFAKGGEVVSKGGTK